MDYWEKIRELIKEFGGSFNAHVHADRAFTYKDKYFEKIGRSVNDINQMTLSEKQSLVWAIHTGSAFKEECIEERMRKFFNESIKHNTRRVDCCIDVTYNTLFKSWNVAKKLRNEFKDRLEIKIGAYNIAGFKDAKYERQELIEKGLDRFKIFKDAAKEADFLVALTEKDRKPGHIGEEQHNNYMLNLGLELGIPIHFHIGQSNTSDDVGYEALFKQMHQVYNVQHRLQKIPQNMLVHDISSSCYSEDDFKKHCDKLLRFNLGVISCVSAGVSMKQDRTRLAPTHNCLARIWDYSIQDIPVYLGIDNLNDVMVPSTTSDMRDELFVLTQSLRGYDPRILAKLASGTKFDNFDKGRLKNYLS